MGRLAPLGAVSAPASDREQHAVSDSARGVGDHEPGLAGAGAQRSALERGLGGGVGTSAGTRGNVRRPVAVRGHGLPRRELGAGGADEGVCPPQRRLYRPARAAQGDVRAPVARRCPRALGRPGRPRGVDVPGDPGELHARGAALAARAIRRDARLSPRPRDEAQARDRALGVCARALGRGVGAGGDGALREVLEPGGAARAGGVARPGGRTLGCAVGFHAVPGDGRYRPRCVGRRAAPVGRTAHRTERPHASARRRRQAHPRRQSPHRRRGVLRDRHPRHPRGAPAREPLLP